MQSNELWLKHLAKSRFRNGRWETEHSPQNLQNAFESLRDDLLEMLEIFNHHALNKVKLLQPSGPSKTLVTLMCATVQMRFVQNDGFLDISMIVTRDFQTRELPVARLKPRVDQFGSTSWQRGSIELSTDQVIKNSFVTLIETSQS